MLTEIEKNIEARRETDRVMWFSMWILLSVASFGVAWFIMIYFLIKRRNDHFLRQEKLETLILSKLRQLSKDEPRQQNSVTVPAKTEDTKLLRNAHTWALSTLLILPAFYVFYSLEMDLQNHEKHEHAFLTRVVLSARDSGLNVDLDHFSTTRKFISRTYLILTIVTCGFAAIYWLYRVFNDYNQHFKRQWKLEDNLLGFLKSINNSKTN